MDTFIHIIVVLCFLIHSIQGIPLQNNFNEKNIETQIKKNVSSSKLLENLDLFQGDIRFPSRPLGLTSRENKIIKTMYATSFDSFLWPKGIVYYENLIEDDYLLDLLDIAMTVIERKTCVKFIEKDSSTQDYVQLVSLNGCWSFVGRVGGPQQLSLGIECDNINLMMHELMHALGFYHKHSQHDRDKYLKIHWENIVPEAKSQFQVLSKYMTRTFSLTKFDYMSVMLYGPRLFSKNSMMITMSRRDGGKLLDVEEKPGLSTQDIFAINSLYKCSL